MTAQPPTGPGRKRLRTVEEHLNQVLALAGPLPPIRVAGPAALGLSLAAPVAATLAVPPFTNSAMDGYAVRAVDVAGATTETPVTLPVQADQPAGATATLTLRPGHAIRIMTGAMLPEQADTIIPVEATDQPRGEAALPSQVQILLANPAGRHLRHRGDDTQVGALVAEAGRVITPSLLSSLASTGHGTFEVHPRPRVWVLSSGDELVEPGEPLLPGQIPDSNGWLLAGLVSQFGAEVSAVTRVTDDVDQLRRTFAAAPAVDLVVTTGGVSAGAFEVIRQVTEGPVTFVEVAMQPGKPQGVGRLELGRVESGGNSSATMAVPLLALPGNPVSVFVSSWLFVRPLIAQLAGRPCQLPSRLLPAGASWATPPDRRQYLPAAVVDQQVVPVHRLGSGSHLVAALHRAEVLAIVPAEVAEVNEGDLVEVFDVTGGAVVGWRS